MQWHARTFAFIFALYVATPLSEAAGSRITDDAQSLTFRDSLETMPEWPKMVLFLPKGTQQNEIEFEWHRKLQKEAGNRIVVLSLVNDTEGDSQIMEVFNLLHPKDLPCAKVIKPGSVDLSAGKMEAYEIPKEKTEWSYRFLKALAEKTWLPINSVLKVDIPKQQVKTQMDFKTLCIDKTAGRCAIYFVNMDDVDEQLEILEAGLNLHETFFYDFHIMWADVKQAKAIFNFPQVDQSKSPQVVVLDVREKLFAPIPFTDSKSLLTRIRTFDQPQAMQKMKDAKRLGKKSALVTDSTLPKGTHTEL